MSTKKPRGQETILISSSKISKFHGIQHSDLKQRSKQITKNKLHFFSAQCCTQIFPVSKGQLSQSISSRPPRSFQSLPFRLSNDPGAEIVAWNGLSGSTSECSRQWWKILLVPGSHHVQNDSRRVLNEAFERQYVENSQLLGGWSENIQFRVSGGPNNVDHMTI